MRVYVCISLCDRPCARIYVRAFVYAIGCVSGRASAQFVPFGNDQAVTTFSKALSRDDEGT